MLLSFFLSNSSSIGPGTEFTITKEFDIHTREEIIKYQSITSLHPSFVTYYNFEIFDYFSFSILNCLTIT